MSYSYLENRSESEDVVQDVFVKMLVKGGEGKILNLKSYIGTAVRNTSLKKIRQSKRMRKLTDDRLVTSPSHEEHLIDKETGMEVQKAIRTLSGHRKKVLELCVLDGLSYEHAADSLGISINTVKYHLKKAYKELRFTLRNTYLLTLVFLLFSIF